MKIEFNSNDLANHQIRESEILESLEINCMAELVGIICEYLVTYIKKNYSTKTDQVQYLIQAYTTMLYMLGDEMADFDIIREDEDDL